MHCALRPPLDTRQQRKDSDGCIQQVRPCLWREQRRVWVAKQQLRVELKLQRQFK
jgi:hypothetical protein